MFIRTNEESVKDAHNASLRRRMLIMHPSLKKEAVGLYGQRGLAF